MKCLAKPGLGRPTLTASLQRYIGLVSKWSYYVIIDTNVMSLIINFGVPLRPPCMQLSAWHGTAGEYNFILLWVLAARSALLSLSEWFCLFVLC